jgi:hypothetical protein
MAAKKSKDAATTIDALMGPSTPEAVPATEIQMEPTEEKDNSRTPRDLEDRAHEEEEMEWQPSRLLPTPKKKDGIDFRYVRVSSGGTVDNMNHSQALRDGWVPVLSDECPELGMIVADVGSAEGNIVFGGMMLCKRNKKIGDKIRAIAARESRAQIDSVDAGYLGDQNASMRKFSDKRSETSFGRK